ncbi:MAG: tRNA (adenosine(37)-N6)-threonylcarbamoyltransferase complex ATPase subunit type 1 TsaE [Deltaproteobacteria bacterium]|nr:tRNA (adenosine(37)-N6)-threonylcarbamoyltransferase complex ATPase subunit type 1 TsaE [Deltaproteobacteria bacterium]
MYSSRSPEETRRVAERIGLQAVPGSVIALVGPLGAGKTCFVQGLARGCGVAPNVIVNSPTFILCNVYPGRVPLYHFDWYRLEHAGQLEGLGPEEYFDGDGISVVEWADKFPEMMPKRAIWITFAIRGARLRTITVDSHGLTPVAL